MSTSSPPSYSGFISNFSTTSPPSGSLYDLISTIGTVDVTGSNTPDYTCSYFHIGNNLIQFTNIGSTGASSIPNLNSNNGHTIAFGKPFSSNPYCVIACPTSGSQQSSTVMVNNSSTEATSFGVYISGPTNTQVGLSYIAIGPYTNS